MRDTTMHHRGVASRITKTWPFCRSFDHWISSLGRGIVSRRGSVFLALLGLSILLPYSGIKAQNIVSGEITGAVYDPTGAVVPDATVSLSSAETGFSASTTTGSTGTFGFPLLRPGTYILSVSANGFRASKSNVTVSLGAVNDVPVKLEVGATTETVEVIATEPPLETENANQSTSFNRDQLENMPTPGNDITTYALIAPGTTVSTGGGYGNFSSFGLPGTSNLFTINGSDNMDPYLNLNNSGASNLTLGANEIQEAAVVTNGYSAQYGRQAGAQVNYVTRSGTNAFHGNAEWWWNGSALNANDWFNNLSGTPRPHAVSNEWAASIGGPVIKNKLFFYADQEGLRYVLPSGGGATYIPTTDFANYVLAHVTPSALPFYTTAMNLYAGSSGASRAVPLTTADDAALGCGDFATAGFGTTIPCARQFQSTVNNLNTEWLFATRVDFNPTDNDRIYFRFWTDHGVQATATDAINPAFNANSVQPAWAGQIGYTRTISAHMDNQLLLSGSYYTAVFGPPNLKAALAVFPTTFSFNDGLFSPLGGGATPNGIADSLNAYPSGRRVEQWQIVDDFSYIRGNHEFKFGVNFRRNVVGDLSYGPGTSGLMTFNSMTDFVNGTLTNGSTFAQSFTRIGTEQIRLYGLGFYVQDQWRVTPKLNLTLALRFERVENPSCAANCFAGLSSTFEGLTHDATQPYNSAIHLGIPNAFRNLDSIDPQPRLGVAYTLTSKTVMRGGVGLFADQFAGTLVSRFFTNTPNVAAFTTAKGSGLVAAPGVANSAFTNLANSNAALQQGFAGGATLAQLQTSVPGFALPNLYTQADQFHVPKYLEWNFEVEQQFTSNLILSVNYVGNRGTDEINQNTFPNAFSATGFGDLPTTAPDARFGEINELSSTGHSNYNGLTSSLRWRHKSFIGRINYTWSHALDTCSNNCLGRFNLLTSPSYRYDFNPFGAGAGGQNYGSADYDTRHTLSANYVWALPSPSQNRFIKGTLGGWTLSGTFLAHSGYPFSITNSSLRSAHTGNTTGIGTTAIQATWIGGSNSMTCSVANVACFTKSEFLTTAQQTNFGNLNRNSFRGPGYFDTDLAVSKNIRLTERFHAAIGANFFNILNHPNFDLPVNSLSSGVFGKIISTVSPPSSPYGSFTGSAVSGRGVQLDAKFQF